MARVEDEQSTFSGYFEVESEEETDQSDPETYLLQPVRLEGYFLLGVIGQCIPPVPSQENGEESEEDGDCPEVEWGNFLVAIVSSELSDARFSYS